MKYFLLSYAFHRLLCTLSFFAFSGQHIFHKFQQQTFFFCTHVQQTGLFLLFWQQTFFFIFFLGLPPDIDQTDKLNCEAG